MANQARRVLKHDSSWRNTDNGENEASSSETTKEEVIHTTALESVSSVGNYSIQSARNHQEFEVAAIQGAAAINKRLQEEIGMGKLNFVYVRDKFEDLDQQLEEQEKNFRAEFKKLDSDLEKRHKHDEKSRQEIITNHQNLVQTVANLRKEFELTTASLEKKIGDIFKILRQKSEDIFAPTDRAIPDIRK